MSELLYNRIIQLEEENKRLRDDVSKLESERETWGNEYSAVFMMKSQLILATTALGLLISNTRLALKPDLEAESNVRRATEIYENLCNCVKK